MVFYKGGTMKILCLFGKHEYGVVSEKVLEDIYDCDNYFAGRMLVDKTYIRCKHCGKKVLISD